MVKNDNNTFVIIVAAGSGNRFGSHIPKQFVGLGAEHKPVLMHTVEAFSRFGFPLERIVVVLSENMADYWEDLCKQFAFTSPRIVFGGKTRFHSVRNALNSIDFKPGKRILVHDGARPLVSSKVIERVLDGLSHALGVIPTVPVTDSLRKKTDDKNSVAVIRSDYMAVQTPQGFSADLIKRLYNREYKSKFTDDASFLDDAGIEISVVEGDPDNIKITTPSDLLIAEALLKARNEHTSQF